MISGILNYRFSVDPGYGGTGFAVWRESDFICPIPSKPEPPVKVGIITPPNSLREEDFVIRGNSIARQFGDLLQDFIPHVVYVEFPVFFDDAGGHMGMKTGDVPKLIYLVGVISEVCRARGAKFYPIPVPDWKGQMPKDMVIKRIHKELGGGNRTEGELICRKLDVKSHSYDAVGIGLYAREEGLE